MKTAILIIFVSLSMHSCVTKLYGIKKYDANFAQYKIDVNGVKFSPCPIDSNFFLRIDSTKSNNESYTNYKQPLQLWLYDKGFLQYATANCYAGGFPNLSWEANCWEKKCSPINVDNKMNIDQHLHLLEPTKMENNHHKSGKVAIIVCAKFMGRQNKLFIKKLISKLDDGWQKKFFYIDSLFR